MSDTDTKKKDEALKKSPAPAKPDAKKEASSDDKKPATKKRRVSFVGKDGKRGPRRPRRDQKSSGEPDQKIIDIRRVTRVMAGGRRFSFSVAVVVGDYNGRVGVGLGKGSDTALAIDKAVKRGKKNMITIPLTKTKSIPREVESKYCSAKVYIQPSPGKGLVAGSALRSVLTLAGVTDVNAKILSRSKNKLNIARAAIDALKQAK